MIDFLEIQLKNNQLVNVSLKNGIVLSVCKGATDNKLFVSVNGNAERELISAVDESEQLDFPKITVIESDRASSFLIFGGEIMYRLDLVGDVKEKIKLFRASSDEEYWVSTIFNYLGHLIIIYEAAFCVIDKVLQIKWHEKKYYNDLFVKAEGDWIEFIQDHVDKWKFNINDGTRVELK